MCFEEFKKYSPSSETITIHYELLKEFSCYKEGTDITLETYADEFSSMIDKNNFSGYETF